MCRLLRRSRITPPRVFDARVSPSGLRTTADPGYDDVMVRYRRNLIPGGTFFFTVALMDRRAEMLTKHISELRQAFRTCRGERPFTIDAIVILPDHLHVVMTLPEDDKDFPGRWRRIKGLFSRMVGKRDRTVRPNASGEYAVWQRRFWEHTIRDDLDYERHVDYIHYNPIKHGHVTQVADWPYSSFHRYVRLGVLPRDWAGVVEQPSAKGFGEPV
jgi:putative transposase